MFRELVTVELTEIRWSTQLRGPNNFILHVTRHKHSTDVSSKGWEGGGTVMS